MYLRQPGRVLRFLAALLGLVCLVETVGCGRHTAAEGANPPGNGTGTAGSTPVQTPAPPTEKSAAAEALDSRPPEIVATPEAAPAQATTKPATNGPLQPPKQPSDGPGGSNYTHKSVTKTAYGSGATAYWIFEPASPAPKQAPVIVFCHGWGAMIPDVYQAWIDHLVRRGNIVIYPKYQDSLTTRPEEFTPNAIVSIQDGLKVLAGEGHVHPDLDRVATVGHSYGGIVCANLAALAASEHLPAFKACMPVEPGTNHFGRPYADYSQMPSSTLLLCVAGEEDHLVRQVDALRIFREATGVAAANKNYLLARGESRGGVRLSADHLAPVCGRFGSQPWQWYGYWKWFDGLTDAAFYNGKHRAYALGDTKEQKDMGVWSDGVAVKMPVVTLGQ